jgi:hypothetical protein
MSSQPYDEPIDSDSASGAEDDEAVPDAVIEDPASDDATNDDNADDIQDVGSPSFGHDVLEGDIW